MQSIMQDFENEPWCYICGSTYMLAPHHCIEGSGRRLKSEEHGLKVLLCLDHHTGRNGVHSGNYELLRDLQEQAQRAFEKTHTRAEFIKEFGLSFL